MTFQVGDRDLDYQSPGISDGELQRAGGGQDGGDVRGRGAGHHPAGRADPVSFAGAVVGTAMYGLACRLPFPDGAGRKAAGRECRVDLECLKLKPVLEYPDKEIVSRITDRVVTPAMKSKTPLRRVQGLR